MTPDEIFLKYSADKLEQLSVRIQDCLARLTDEQIWARGSDNENAVGNLVLHLCGNVRQWILGGIAGDRADRNRDGEFQVRGGPSADELAERLSETVNRACDTIRNLPITRLTEQITIQDYKVSVLESIYHVVEHFSNHTGQILFATKLATGEDLGYYRHLSRARHEETIP